MSELKMDKRITIIDYGLGNLHSVSNAFRTLDCEVILAQTACELGESVRIVLPGVGAFSDGMAGLTSRGFDVALRNHCHSGGVILGICLGAQLLMEAGEEFGLHAGLGILPGKVVRIPSEGVKVPHTGWAQLLPPMNQTTLGGVLSTSPVGSWSYFIHSFHILPSSSDMVSATCSYGSHILTAAVQSGRTIGFQFHPEKSGQFGLDLLKRFMESPID